MKLNTLLLLCAAIIPSTLAHVQKPVKITKTLLDIVNFVDNVRNHISTRNDENDADDDARSRSIFKAPCAGNKVRGVLGGCRNLIKTSNKISFFQALKAFKQKEKTKPFNTKTYEATTAPVYTLSQDTEVQQHEVENTTTTTTEMYENVFLETETEMVSFDETTEPPEIDEDSTDVADIFEISEVNSVNDIYQSNDPVPEQTFLSENIQSSVEIESDSDESTEISTLMLQKEVEDFTRLGQFESNKLFYDLEMNLIA